MSNGGLSIQELGLFSLSNKFVSVNGSNLDLLLFFHFVFSVQCSKVIYNHFMPFQFTYIVYSMYIQYQGQSQMNSVRKHKVFECK